MTTWRVWEPGAGQSCEDGRVIEADTLPEAAEEWARRDDWDTVEFRIARGGEATVFVRRSEPDSPVFRCVVTAETAPTYHARVVLDTGGES